MGVSKRIILFLGCFVIAAIIAAVVFAAQTDTGSITPTVGGASGGGIANATFATADLPSWNPIVNTTVSISSGDLYKVDSSGANAYAGDIVFRLRFTNLDKISLTYSSFVQEINVKMLSSQVTGETVGTGDGATTVYLLNNAPVAPGTLVVKVNSVTKAETTDYTVDYKLGKITFVTAPGNTLPITANYWYNNPVSGTAYQNAPTSAGKAISYTPLTLEEGVITLFVAGDTGGAKYKVVVDGGYAHAVTISGVLAPAYYFAADQS